MLVFQPVFELANSDVVLDKRVIQTLVPLNADIHHCWKSLAVRRWATS